MTITKCQGEGQGTCRRCADKGKWNRSWMCFLYKIEGIEGCYCRNCVAEIAEGQDRFAMDTLIAECTNPNN